MAGEAAIRDRLTGGSLALTRSDAKIARALLADYPAAGLGTVATLAQAAGVSGPTVLRFVARLGFDGFPEFQRALIAEVQERMSSPLDMIAAGKAELPEGGAYGMVLSAAARMIEAAATLVPAGDLEEAAHLVADPRLRVHCIGGRFSGWLAGLLWAHLRHLRADCFLVSGSRSDQVDALADIGRRDVVVAYDYRRYQLDTIRFAGTAAGQGARIILFTDPWASPIAAQARVVLAAPVEGPSPFDSMVPALAQTEALIAAATARLAPGARARIERIEALRRTAGITVDPPHPIPAPDRGRTDRRPE